jgi:hypothetical protein
MTVTSTHRSDRYERRRQRQSTEVGRRIRRMSTEIAENGLLEYVRRRSLAGEALPYPFSDGSRWADIAADPAAPADWRAAARWLLARSPVDARVRRSA